MLKLMNMEPAIFREYAKDKEVYVFGAGRLLDSCLSIYFGETDISGIIDNSTNIWGNHIYHRDKSFLVMGADAFAEIVKRKGTENILLLITSSFYAADIVEQLDKFIELDGLETFLQIALREAVGNAPPFSFSKGERRIPKIIHYIWVGKKEIPAEYKKNIESWKKYNPDYEIIEWNEGNYNFGKCRYMKEAYESKAWGFVPNYARLDIVHEHGGIYLDVDVEAISNFDCLLNDNSFFNMGYADRVNQGCGFGAVPQNDILREMKEAFEASQFLGSDGFPRKKPCHQFIHPALRKRGFELVNKYQNIGGDVLYPCEVMSPQTVKGSTKGITDNTVAIHKEAGSWRSQKERDGLIRTRKLVENRVLMQ